MDIFDLRKTGDAETLELLRRLSNRPDDSGRAEREIVSLVIDLLGPRHVPALVAYRRLTEEYLPWMEQRLVRRAHGQGSTWADIGRTLHRTRQAVRHRFAYPPTMDDMLPPRCLVDRTSSESALDAADLDRRRLRSLSGDASTSDQVVPW